MQLSAYMNYGRWIMICPRCTTALPAWDTGVVCPKCYPDMMAKAFRPLKNGDLRPVTDVELVEAARSQARAADEEYFPIYPAERGQIEAILRLRPSPANMNWIETETLEDLCNQNLEHGDPIPAKE